METKINFRQINKVAVLAGSAVLFAGAALNLLKVKSVKEGIMPVVTILVAASAFTFALQGGNIAQLTASPKA